MIGLVFFFVFRLIEPLPLNSPLLPSYDYIGALSIISSQTTAPNIE